VSRALAFPAGTVAHLPGEGGELADLLALQRAGVPLALLALPAAVEDSLYRYNNLPARLAAVYAHVDPFDPDEDDVEEAEAAAHALLSAAHLLDDVIDAVYDGLEGLPNELVVRRPGAVVGEPAVGRRGVLLAIRALARSDWRASAVMERLTRHASVALDARPVIVHARDAEPDEALSRLAAGVLGRPATVYARDGGVTGVR
jgi:hypothetical protein